MLDSVTDPSFISNFFTSDFFGLVVQYAINILGGFGTIIIGFWISGRIAKTIRKTLSNIPRLNQTLVPVAASFARYSGMTLTTIIALGNFGIQTTSIIAVLGAAGLAIGLALQGTLSNVAAGVMLLILRPFNVGDWVESAGVSGTIVEIGLFTCQFNTFDGIFIAIPNSTIWSSTIINHAKNKNRRSDLVIGVGYESDFDVVEKALMSLSDDERIHKTPEPQFQVVSYDDSAITVRLRFYADYDDLFPLNWDLNRRLKPTLDAHGIDIPFPQRVIHMKSEGAE